MNEKIKLPLIKAYKIDRLLQALDIFYNHPFDRDSLRESILQHYNGKEEKSVFRGMIIPSLRHLGFIIGYENDLRLSANGNLIVIAKKRSYTEGIRVFKAVIAEIDNINFGILELLSKNPLAFNKLKAQLVKRIEAPSEKQALERFNHWFSMLIDLELLYRRDEKIAFAKETITQMKIDLSTKNKERYFKNIFFDTYNKLLRKQENVPIVDIEDLRREAAGELYQRRNLILTESQFDFLLRRISFITKKYMISLGRSMGADEKLFEYKDNYYRTVSIRFLR